MRSKYDFDYSPPEHIVIGPSSSPPGSANTSADNSFHNPNLGNIYDFAGAMGVATPLTNTPYSTLEGQNIENAFSAAANVLMDQREKEKPSGKVASAGAEIKFGQGGGEREKEVQLEKFRIDSCLPKSGFNRDPASPTTTLMTSKQHKNSHHNNEEQSSTLTDDHIIGQILLGRLGLTACLSQRLEKLKELKKNWRQGDVWRCAQYCKKLVSSDEDGSQESVAVVADFLRSIDIRNEKIMTLDVATIMLEVVSIMILGQEGKDGVGMDCTAGTLSGDSTLAGETGATLKGKPHATIAMKSCSEIISAFGRMVHGNILSGMGKVDVAGEERKQKFFSMHKIIARLSDRFCLEQTEDIPEGGAAVDARSGSLQFLGLVDASDVQANAAAMELQKLLMKYERGKI